MRGKFDLDPNLRPFATEKQWERLSAWAEHGSVLKAMKALGLSSANLITQAKDAVLKKAALRGYIPPPSPFSGVRVPPGFILRGQSALVDAAGNLRERWDKTRQEGLSPEEAVSLPDPKKIVKLSTMYDAEGRAVVQWVSEKPEDREREQAWRAFAAELAADLPRVDPAPAPRERDLREDLLAGYPVGDHHLGMLAWGVETGASYDMKIAEDLLVGAFRHLTQAVGPTKEALIAFLGDFLHYDSFESVTPTNRNILDSDTRYPKMVRAGVRMIRNSVDCALAQHEKVALIIEIGNHDPASAVFLAECLRAVYEREPRVYVNTSPRHFHYHRFGQVLIGTHHGHGVKMADLPLLMATDCPEDWGQTSYRYFWTGHYHNGRAEDATRYQDYNGCVVERFRVLPPADAWAHQRGWRSHRDMKAIVYHRQYGEVARYSVNPTMLERADGN